MAKARSTKPQTPEARLAKYWRAKSRLTKCAFDRLHGDVERCRPTIDFSNQTGELSTLRDLLAMIIWTGGPLTFAEYHFAIAAGYIVSNPELPYEEFYKTRWHETALSMGYSPIPKDQTHGSKRRKEGHAWHPS